MRPSAVLLAAALGASGCALYTEDDDGPGGGAEPLSCELRDYSYTYHQPKLDLLFVVDTSPAMADYRERLIDNLARFALVLETVEGGLPDIHVGVTSSDIACTDSGGGALVAEPAIEGCAAPGGTYLIDERDPWFTCGPRGSRCGATNYDGGLGDAFACMAALPTGTCEPRQPLAAAVAALTGDDPSTAGFRRDEAYLMVVIVSAGDDASPGAVADYLGTLDALPPNDLMFMTSVIAPSSAVRLRAFAEELPYRGSVVDVENTDWIDAFIQFAELTRATTGYSCFPDLDPTDTDLTNFGLQPECSVVRANDPATQIPACAMIAPERPHPDTALPCWWVARDEDGCGYHPIVEGVELAEWRCAAACE